MDFFGESTFKESLDSVKGEGVELVVEKEPGLSSHACSQSRSQMTRFPEVTSIFFRLNQL